MSTDKPIITYAEGVALMLENRFNEAETRFGINASTSTRHRLMYAEPQFAKACLSLSSDDVTEALDRLWDALNVAENAISSRSSSVMSSALSYVWGSNESVDEQQHREIEDMEDTVISADAYQMISLLEFLTGNYIKGAWHVRTSYKLYEGAYMTLTKDPTLIPSSLRCSIRFGVGLFNLVVSLLPSQYIPLVEFAGFSGSRSKALEELRASYSEDEFWSPLASLLLLFFYTQLCPYLGIPLVPADIDECDNLISDGRGRFPESALFMWMEAGLCRLRGQLIRAVELNEKARSISVELPPLSNMIGYDAAWAFFIQRDWASAAARFLDLSKSDGTPSSSAGYTYLTGLALAIQGYHDDAATYFATVQALLSQRNITSYSTARFVLSRSKAVNSLQFDVCDSLIMTILAYEAMILWNVHSHMGVEHALEGIAELEALLADKQMSKRAANELHMLSLVHACLCVVAQCNEEARTRLEEIISQTKVAGPTDHDYKHILPFAYYHLGSLLSAENEVTSATELFKRAQEHSDYHHYDGLSLRLHAAVDYTNNKVAA